MRENDGRRLDHETLERLRMRAVRQIELGARPKDVAEALGLRRSTVYGWLAAYREGGPDALRAKPVPGRPPRLSPEQVRRLFVLLAENDPRHIDPESTLWTRELVRALIRHEFGMTVSMVTVGRLLRDAGLATTRPYERGAVGAWLPALLARARAAGAAVYFADEVRATLRMIYAATLKGTPRFALYHDEPEAFTDFCERLPAAGPVILVVPDRPAFRVAREVPVELVVAP